MNLLDLGIIVLLILVTLRGYFRGLFQELAVLAGLVGGLLVAAHTYHAVGALLLPLVKNIAWARGIAFALVLVVFYWGVRLVGYILNRILYHLHLDLLERLLGAFFALLKGSLILGMALLLLGLVLPKNTRLLKESLTTPPLTKLARRTLDYLPPDVKKRLKEYLHKVPRTKEPEQTENFGRNETQAVLPLRPFGD